MPNTGHQTKKPRKPQVINISAPRLKTTSVSQNTNTFLNQTPSPETPTLDTSEHTPYTPSLSLKYPNSYDITIDPSPTNKKACGKIIYLIARTHSRNDANNAWSTLTMPGF